MKNIADNINMAGDTIRHALWDNIYSNFRVNGNARINYWIIVYRNINDNIQNNIYESLKSNLNKQ